jgi:hypothetical protein
MPPLRLRHHASGNLIVDVRAKDHHGSLVIATAFALWSAARRDRYRQARWAGLSRLCFPVDFVRFGAESGRKPRHLFTVAFAPKQKKPWVKCA